MSKQIIICGQLDIDNLLTKLRISAELAQINLRQLMSTPHPLELLYQMKFEEIGCDPLDSKSKLNLIEQLNQTFTYIASLKAASYLLQCHPPFRNLTLNLGTKFGWDIESDENGGLVAEVFAAVKPNNNRKLYKDMKKVAAENRQNRYVFFICPGIEAGLYQGIDIPHNINIISLGWDIL